MLEQGTHQGPGRLANRRPQVRREIRAAQAERPQLHRGSKEMTHPGNTEQVSSLHLAVLASLLLLCAEQRIVPKPFPTLFLQPFFFLSFLLSHFPRAGMRKEILRNHSTLPTSIEVLVLQQTPKAQGLAKRKRRRISCADVVSPQGPPDHCFISGNLYLKFLQHLPSKA